MSDRETAAGDLGLVQAFVNSVDLEPGVEELRDPNTLQAWLVAKGLMGSDEPVHETGYKRHAVAPGQVEVPRSGVGALHHPAQGQDLAAGHVEASGAVGAIGRLVAAMYAAMQAEEWERLKLCGSGTCRWAFYDRSRNQSSRWCNMASCGNREKARRFRSKTSSPRGGEVARRAGGA